MLIGEGYDEKSWNDENDTLPCLIVDWFKQHVILNLINQKYHQN